MEVSTSIISKRSLFLVTCVLTLGLPGLPLPLAFGVDESWQAILAHAAIVGLHFGRDVIFNYGPLGVLENTHQLPELFWRQVGWQLFTRFMAAIVMVRFLQGRDRRVAWLFTACALVFLHTARTTLVLTDSFHYLVLLLCGFTLIGPGIGWPHLVIATILPSLIALVKFNLLLLAVSILFVAVSFRLWERRMTHATVIASLSTTTIMAGWLTTGQPLDGFLEYVEISLHMATSYVWAMSLSAHPVKMAFAAVLGLGLIWLIKTGSASLRSWRTSDTVAVSMLMLTCGLAWKHSFTRADPVHMPGFFVLVFFILLLWPALPLPVAESQLQPRRRVIIALSVLAFGGTYLAARDIMPGAPRRALHNVLANIKFVFYPAQTKLAFEHLTEQLRKHMALPAIRAEVGSARVDLHGNEQSVAIANRLNYLPRPIIQSYSVFTPRLDAINTGFLQSTKPDFVLFRLLPIDGRWPTIEDSGALGVMISNYTPCLQENGWLLLKRKPRPPAAASGVVHTADVSAGWSQWITLSQDYDTSVWLSVSVKPTWLGSLIGLMYQPPALYLETAFNDGTKLKARLPISMAKSKFLLSPSLSDEWITKAGVNVLEGRQRVHSFRFVPAGWLAQKCYQAPLAVSLQNRTASR